MAAKAYVEPTSRWGHLSAQLQGKVFVWAGRGKGFKENRVQMASVLNVYDPSRETWKAISLKGTIPPGLYFGACTAAGSCIYLYGGYDGAHGNCAFHRLDTSSHTWTRLPDGLLRLSGAMMVPYLDKIVLFGGYGFNPNSESKKPIRYNSIYTFDIETEVWSSQGASGTLPPPVNRSTLTMIDNHRAVLFGGRQKEYRTHGVYVLDLAKMVWREIPKTGSTESWPSRRSSHAAACVGYGTPRPQLVVIGGVGNHSNVLGDVWMLDVEAGKWTEVLIANFTPRESHSINSVALGPKVVEVVIFGGICEWPENAQETGAYPHIGDTTVLRFEYQKSEHASEGQWVFTDVADPSSLGTGKRLEAKRKRLSQLHSHISNSSLSSSSSAPQSSQAGPIPTPQSGSVSQPSTLPSRGSASVSRSSSNEQEASMRYTEDRAREMESKVAGAEKKVREYEQKARFAEERSQALESRAVAAEQRAQNFETEILYAKERAQSAEERARKAEERFKALAARPQASIQEMEALRSKLEAKVREVKELEEKVQAEERRAHRLEQDMQSWKQRAETAAKDAKNQWAVQRSEVFMTEEVLGGGGWGQVKVAIFRGAKVAVKLLYNQLQYDYYRDLFVREMNMAARIRHPNLVQFIGATQEGEMMILTELLPTNLREHLVQHHCSAAFIRSVALDTARGLNYLHLMQPDPIIHRDISSANVLLEPLASDQWRAKITDYGSVNFQAKLKTVGPGSPVYAAPETHHPTLQTPKMDVFSFGILLIEVCTRRFPEVSARETLIASIRDQWWVELIHKCIHPDKDRRLSAAEIIEELHHDGSTGRDNSVITI